jgi:hypothetical protein
VWPGLFDDLNKKPYRKKVKGKIQKRSTEADDFLNDIFDDPIEELTGIPPDPMLKKLYGDIKPPFHCLSVKQPYADLLVSGVKDVENRTWDTNYRGPLLIQATATPDRAGFRSMKHGDKAKYLEDDLYQYTRQKFVGIVNVKDCVKNYRNSDWIEAGMWHWVVTDAVMFENPMHVKGKLGIWSFDDKTYTVRNEIWSLIGMKHKIKGRGMTSRYAYDTKTSTINITSPSSFSYQMPNFDEVNDFRDG